jgi:Protein of unknown function (DUF3499)
MSGRVRLCSRPDCAEPAVVSLTYDYGRSQVWLDDLSPERDPHAYDMCRRHAARLSVPLGWRLAIRSGKDPVALELSA